MKDFKSYTECSKASRGPALGLLLHEGLVLSTQKTKVGPSDLTLFTLSRGQISGFDAPKTLLKYLFDFRSVYIKYMTDHSLNEDDQYFCRG